MKLDLLISFIIALWGIDGSHTKYLTNNLELPELAMSDEIKVKPLLTYSQTNSSFYVHTFNGVFSHYY